MTLAPGELGWLGYPAGTPLGPWPMTLGGLPLDQTDEYGSPWNVTEFVGKGSPPTEVEATQRETGHGAWVGHALWAAKPYSITGAYEGGDPVERWAAEQRLLAAVPMATTPTLLVFHEETERQTEVVLNGELTIDPVGEDDEQQRNADPVVQSTLDVEALPDAGREPRLCNYRLAERRVRRGEHDRKHERLGDGELAEEGSGEQASKRDG